MPANTNVKPVEETMKLSDTKQQFSKVINRVARGEANVIVEKSGLPIAAIVPMDKYRPLIESNEEIQGETLYHLVQGGYVNGDDLSDDEEMDIAVYLVRLERLN